MTKNTLKYFYTRDIYTYNDTKLLVNNCKLHLCPSVDTSVQQ